MVILQPHHHRCRVNLPEHETLALNHYKWSHHFHCLPSKWAKTIPTRTVSGSLVTVLMVILTQFLLISPKIVLIWTSATRN